MARMTGTYLVRVLLLRYVSFLYLIAFLVAYFQNPSLLGNCGKGEGDKTCPESGLVKKPMGLLPAAVYLQRVYKHFDQRGRSRPDQLQVWDIQCMRDAFYTKPLFLVQFIRDFREKAFSSVGKLESVGSVLSYFVSIPSELFSLFSSALGGQFGHCGNANNIQAFKAAATVLWFVPHQDVDDVMNFLALSGVAVSAAILVSGRANALLMIYIWVGYMSIINVGQTWYSFGWESQLLETGFLAIFMCPLLPRVYPFVDCSVTRKRGKFHSELPWVVKYGYRWLIVRIMLGAGFIKLRGDTCWRDMTCMDYHYQTQPVPNPFSILFHASSAEFHSFEVWVNHFVECAAPFFILLPQPGCAIGGLIQILFQFTLISSGNLSFLNWLTITPSIACFQDRHVAWLFSRESVRQAQTTDDDVDDENISSDDSMMAVRGAIPPLSERPLHSELIAKMIQRSLMCSRFLVHLILFLTIVTLSIPVVRNLLSPQQAMNTSFDWLRLVNTYGAFGSVTKTRNEIIIEGKSRVTGEWMEYEFHCKPGDEWRLPCVISPYHYRLDWLAWFAAFQRHEQNPWLIALAHRMLTAHKDSSSRLVIENLLSVDPFLQRTASSFKEASMDYPTAIRIWLVPYEYNLPHNHPMQRRQKRKEKREDEEERDQDSFPDMGKLVRCVGSNLLNKLTDMSLLDRKSDDDEHTVDEKDVRSKRQCPVRFWKRGPKRSWKVYLPEVRESDTVNFVNRLNRY